jgi:hypothetical protein
MGMDWIGVTSVVITTLTIIFIVLKICGEITWSLWWVFSPILIPLAILILLVIVAGIVLLCSKKKKI